VKPSTAVSLSSHLLQEARRFLGFPKRVYRNDINLQLQSFFDKLGGQMITERETFLVSSKSKALLASGEDTLFFDELPPVPTMRETVEVGSLV